MTLPGQSDIDVGDRVILAEASSRAPNVLGTVIERDPYPDRGVVVCVLHEDGRRRWRRLEQLRRLHAPRMDPADLAADLVLQVSR